MWRILVHSRVAVQARQIAISCERFITRCKFSPNVAVLNLDATDVAVSLPGGQRESSDILTVGGQRHAVRVHSKVSRPVRNAARGSVCTAVVRHVLRLPGQCDHLSTTSARTWTLRGAG